MSDKEWVKIILVLGLVIALVSAVPSIVRYVMVKDALDDFTEAVEKSLHESNARNLAYAKEQKQRKSLLAQAEIKKEEAALYSNAACVLNEGSGKCVCIDTRTNKTISIETSACKRRASQYNY